MPRQMTVLVALVWLGASLPLDAARAVAEQFGFRETRNNHCGGGSSEMNGCSYASAKILTRRSPPRLVPSASKITEFSQKLD